MLEAGRMLATWRIGADLLDLPAGRTIEATRINDHRKAYLDYAGPVSGDRGRVDPADRGRLGILAASEDLWEFDLDGDQLQGRFELRCTEAEHGTWTFRRLPADPGGA